MKLFRRLILRPLRRDRARTALTLISIALGVAVVVAIELAGDAAVGSFQNSLTTLTGPVDYVITANGGIDERYVAKLSSLPINATFSPVLERPIRLDQSGFTTVYGIDTVALGLEKTTAASKPQTLSIQGKPYQVFRSDAFTAMDIADVQVLTASYGKLDRIEVFLHNDDPDRTLRAIKSVIPAAWDIETPGARSEENRRMLRAFRWNLRALSYISLLVGAFLIYNTIAVSVVRRRVEIGILRALGTSARGVMIIFLGEATMLGLLGSLAGLALGRFLAAAIVGLISGTINAIFTTSAPGAVTLTPTSTIGAILAGTGVAFLSALIPAREASRVAPADAMRREAPEQQPVLHLKRDILCAVLFTALTVLCSQLQPIDGKPVFGYLAGLFEVAAAAFIAPAFVLYAIPLLPLRRLSIIAGRTLTASLSRTSIVVIALATAIAMMISVGVMVGSFRETVQVWLETQLRADIYLRAAGQPSAGVFPPIDNAVPEIIRQTPGVTDVDVFHAFTFRYEGTQATFGAGDTSIVRKHRQLHFLTGGFGNPNHSDTAIVSEPFANKHNVHTGDTLHIPLGTRTANLLVTGVYYDYASDRGYVITDRQTLFRYLPDQPITNIGVYTDGRRLYKDLRRRLSNYPVDIAANQMLRQAAVEVFDRTFAITYALEAVAILVAMLGAANSLLALVLDRKREIGLIRYLGGAREQVRRMVLTQAGIIGLLAGSLGLALGMALSLLLIFVINKQSFGWTIQFHPPIALIGGALLLVWLVTVLAGIYPARFAGNLEPAEAVHEE